VETPGLLLFGAWRRAASSQPHLPDHRPRALDLDEGAPRPALPVGSGRAGLLVFREVCSGLKALEGRRKLLRHIVAGGAGALPRRIIDSHGKPTIVAGIVREDLAPGGVDNRLGMNTDAISARWRGQRERIRGLRGHGGGKHERQRSGELGERPASFRHRTNFSSWRSVGANGGLPFVSSATMPWRNCDYNLG